MSDDNKLQVDDTIAASPAAIFALLSDPARHTELDGAGMFRASTPAPTPSPPSATRS